jgi:surfeit locus 1 family protein
MSLPRRTIGFIVFALLVSLGCVRLGFWQLSRLRERQARNATIETRIAQPAASLSEIVGDSVPERYRAVHISGRFDYQNELTIANRSRSGSPGVHLLTPLLVAGMDTAVLVLRGWVYAADSKSVTLEQWREADSVTINGFVETFAQARGPVAVTGEARSVRVPDLDSLRTRVPYPIARFLITQTSDSAERADHPARLKLPAIDDGPHRAYALQWFSFAIIAWVGIAAVVLKGRRSNV